MSWLSRCSSARPGIEIQIRDGVHGSVLEHVNSGAADIGILCLAERALSPAAEGSLETIEACWPND